MTMKMVNIAEAKTQLSELLEAAVNGERVVICKRNQPIAEIRAVGVARTAERPLGLAAGWVTLPDVFFEPLPDDVLAAFDTPLLDADLLRASVSEPRHPPFGATGLPAPRGPRAKR
jgi:antitoxin (DNA-binding transcriptional repressor) of toxin-antitoxin stability system